jgi:hypothetical protein
MRQRCTIRPRTGQDVNGKPTYGDPVSYKCRIAGKRQRVWDQDDREVFSSKTIYLYSGDPVLQDAKVTLSTADVGSTESWAINPPIIATGQYPDESGTNVYTQIWL